MPSRFLPLALLALLCCLPAPQAVAGGQVALTQVEQDWLAANPRILLGADAHWRPYVWARDNGTPAGVEVDLVARINALTGANLQLVLGDWAEVVERARRGELHGLAVSASHPERADRFLFSASPYSTHKYIYTRRGSPIERMGDLSGRAVGVLKGNLAELKLLRKWPEIRPVELETALDQAVALQNGRLDAVIASADLLWAIDETLLPDPQLAFPVPDSRIDLRYSIGKEHAPLLSIIDKALMAIEPVEMMRILHKWGSEQRPGIDLSEDELAWLAQKHRVRVRVGEHPPWEIDKPEPQGMAVDYLHLIGTLFDIDFQYVPGEESWADGFEDLAGAHRRYDLLPSAKRTDERLARVGMSQDYLVSPWSIFTRKETQGIRTLADLRGRTVAVERGYVMQELLEAAEPSIRLSPQAGTKDALLVLSNGDVDAYVGNQLVTDYLMQAQGIVNLKVAGPTPFGGHKQAMAVRKDWAPLVSLIDKGLKAIPGEQQIAIRQRWLAPVAQGGGRVELSPEERAYLDATRFRRGHPMDWTPFDFADRDGTATGVAEDYWALIRDKLGLHEVGVERRPFRQILADLERGETDLFVPTTRTPDRERYALFSDPYERYPLAIAGSASAGLYSGGASLEGRRVAVGRGYSAYHLLKAQAPGIEFVLVDDTRAALEAVAQGRADVAVDILPVLFHEAEGFRPGQVKLVGVTDVQFPLQVMVDRRHAALIPLIDRAIAAITPEERAAIQNKWLLRQVVTAPDYTLLWQVLGMALSILAIILYWTRRLHLEVERRKRAEAELTRAKQAADSASRAKGDFLANMSHEIRTPLNAVIGLTHLSLASDPPPTLRDYLGKIALSARTLLALVNDVLDLSRIEAGKLHARREPLELSELLNRVRAVMEQQAAEKGLELRVEAPAEPLGTLLGDGLRLTQVLLNLAGNAVKFTNRGSVTVSARVEAEDAQGVRLGFAVTDTGIGIPADRRADLFEAFTQVDSSDARRQGGSGLGLAISARLVALMGGRLELESEEGVGSRFWFALTLGRAAERAGPEPADPALEALTGARVLVAEDDPVSQVVARELLQRQGARVTLVANGEEAVAAAAGGGFDLVLMDIRMPGLDGLRACRRIRALPGWDRPIVALTANALSSERERCLAAGMAGYLTKPLEPSTFYAEVCRSLGRPGGAAGEGGGDGCGDGFGEAPGPDSGGAPAAPVGFDGAKLRHWLEDLPEVWGPIVRAFRADYPGAMAAIRAALDADDRAVAGDLLHRLRGSAGALGARGLSEAAGYLELALSSPGPVDAALAADLFAQAEAALAVLAGLEPPAPEGAPAEVARAGPDECRQRLRDLEALLAAGNTRALGYVPWVEGCLCPEAPAAGQALLAQMEALDFPAALKTLKDGDRTLNHTGG